MQQVNKNEMFDMLDYFINKTNDNYITLLETLKREYVDYPDMNISLLDGLVNTLDASEKNLESDILGDIMNLNGNSAVMGNVYQNLKTRLYDKLFYFSEDEFSKALVLALKQQYYLRENMERKLRLIFFHILLDEMDKIKDKIIVNNMAILELIMVFKYSMPEDVLLKHLKSGTFFLMNNVSKNKEKVFNKNFLDKLITDTIDTLLGMSDEDLASDDNYAKAIVLSALLRSIFVIIDDYKKLIPYEEYYNNKEKEETVAKSFVRNAFITHYDDMNKEALKKLSKA